MLVTEIKKNLRYKRLNEIYLDYEYAFSLYDNEMKKLEVFEGAQIDKNLIENKIFPLLKKNALNDALKIVARSTTTKKNIKDKLKIKKYPEEVIDYAVDYTSERGYVDDDDYAKSFVKSAVSKGKGQKYIEFELTKRGIDKERIRELVSEYSSSEDVKNVFLKKLKSVMGNKEAPDYKDINKVKDYLLRQGFSYDEIMEALSSVKGDYEY